MCHFPDCSQSLTVCCGLRSDYSQSLTVCVVWFTEWLISEFNSLLCYKQEQFQCVSLTDCSQTETVSVAFHRVTAHRLKQFLLCFTEWLLSDCNSVCCVLLSDCSQSLTAWLVAYSLAAKVLDWDLKLDSSSPSVATKSVQLLVPWARPLTPHPSRGGSCSV